MKKMLLFSFLLLFFLVIGTNVFGLTILSDNFNDGDISDWDVNSGTWSAVNLDLNGGLFAGASISHSVPMSAGNDYNMSFRFKDSSSGLVGSFNWYTDQNGVGNLNGYQIIFQDATVRLRKVINGGTSNLFVSSGISLDVWHDVNIIQVAGLISIKLDDIVIGTVYDSTYTSGSKVFFATENGNQSFAFDDLIIKKEISTTRTIIVLRPLDEKTFLPIDKNWTASLINSNADYQDANNSQKIFIGSVFSTNTNDLVIDDGGVDEYFSRTYSIYLTPNDANVYTLQPYLIKPADGSLVTFILYDKISNITLSNFLFSSKKTVDQNANTLIEQAKSNANGSVTFSFLDGQYYSITVSDINGTNTYFPLQQQNNTFNNTFTPNNIYISSTSLDVNSIGKNYNISHSPNSPSLVISSSQKIDVNVGTDFADYIQVQLLDGNTSIILQSNIGKDFNFSQTINTQNFLTNFLVLKVRIVEGIQSNLYIYTYYLTTSENISSIDEGIIGYRNSTGVWGGVILTLVIIILALQQFGGSLYGNNESQIFLVGLILIACGILFFSNLFFPIIAALTVGVIIYLNQRS